MKSAPLFLGCFLLVALGIFLLPVQAATTMPDTFPGKDLTFNKVIDILNLFVSWIFTVFMIVAVIFVIIAAFHFLVSGSNPAGVKKATHMLVYAAIAIAVALLSVGIRSIVSQLVTGSGGSSFCDLPGNAGDPDCRGPLPPY